MTDYVTLSHDGFARTFAVRQTATVRIDASCDWCGRVNKSQHKPAVPQLFRYGTVAEDRPDRPQWQKGLFCSKPCFNDYTP